MSAHPRVSIEQITDALRQNGGNVTATAEHVGMTRNSLMGRLAVASIDVNTFRRSPLRSTGRKPAPVRVGAAHEAALQDARFDLQYLLRQELTASDVLAMMLDEELAGWIKRKVETLSAGRKG